jgi:hypothetical protein
MSKSSFIVSSMRAVVPSVDGDLGGVVFEDILEEVAVLFKEKDSVLEEDNKLRFFFA